MCQDDVFGYKIQLLLSGELPLLLNLNNKLQRKLSDVVPIQKKDMKHDPVKRLRF